MKKVLLAAALFGAWANAAPMAYSFSGLMSGYFLNGTDYTYFENVHVTATAYADTEDVTYNGSDTYSVTSDPAMIDVPTIGLAEILIPTSANMFGVNDAYLFDERTGSVLFGAEIDALEGWDMTTEIGPLVSEGWDSNPYSHFQNIPTTLGLLSFTSDFVHPEEFSAQFVPEPAPAVLFGLGIAALGAVRRISGRRRP